MLPAEFIHRIKSRFSPEEADAFLCSLENSPAVSLRLHPQKPSLLPHETSEAVSWCALGKFLTQRPEFIFDPLLHAGAYYVQESSSMFLEKAIQKIKLPTNASVLDLCASPGGKSTHLLSLMPEDAVLTSNEVIRTRIPALKENIQRWGYPNVIISNSDPSEFEQFPGHFDVIVTDAPCSGEGMFRKDHAARSHWNDENLRTCELRQNRILDSVHKALKTGGYLVYSTCTFNPGENELQIKRLLNNGFEYVPILEDEKSFPEITRVQHENREVGYAFYPHKVKGEGFFIALLRKVTDSVDENNVQNRFRKPYFSKRIQIPHAALPFLNPDVKRNGYERNGQLFVLQERVAGELEILESGLQIMYAGVQAGMMKGNEFMPDHALALSLLLNKNIPHIELGKEEALQFLKKESIRNHEREKGIYAVTFQNLPIGWVKAVPGRLNNLLPPEFRIRKNLSF